MKFVRVKRLQTADCIQGFYRADLPWDAFLHISVKKTKKTTKKNNKKKKQACHLSTVTLCEEYMRIIIPGKVLLIYQMSLP